MKTWFLASAAGSLVFSTAGHAQTTYHWPATAFASNGVGQEYHLPVGTPIPLRTRATVSTKLNKAGDRIDLEVAEDVVFREQVIIPAGTPVVGEISMAQSNGHLGKKGKLEIRLLEVQTPHGPARLSGTAYDEGKSGTALSLATMVFVSTLGGFLIHGTSAEIPAGTEVEAYLASDLRFAWSRAAIAAAPVRTDGADATTERAQSSFKQ